LDEITFRYENGKNILVLKKQDPGRVPGIFQELFWKYRSLSWQYVLSLSKEIHATPFF